jgi:hypothetical protein
VTLIPTISVRRTAWRFTVVSEGRSCNNLGAAISLAAMDQDEEAKIALNAAREHPEASDFVRTQAAEILSSLTSD